MQHMKRVAIAAALLSVVACGPRDDAQAADPSDALAVPDPAVPIAAASPEPPSGAEILRSLYALESGDGTRATADDGAMATYWFGHAFELDGQRYFTGFTSLTAEAEGTEESSSTMEPSHVAIGQVTMVLGGDPATWTTISRDGYVGEFGQRNQAETIDASRQATSHTTPDGRLVLAIPTRGFDRGVSYAAYAMFVFNQKGVEGQPFRMWTYAGTLPAGSDNDAACVDGAVLTCARSVGTLTFEPSPDGGLPRLRVELSGEEVSGPDEVRALGSGDASVFAYDDAAGRYVQ
ncbi:hypothetical protein [Luteimonas sp. 3794]|uniref:hypothetical protein n=1 Tax=Luteimonas sp. 3794 TaxID=2817730 RepID=UPI00286440E2|nr:hypothetical protein [Luteimonas sp. 3794]MDR6990948.1 hypothetical protein [Luteimonas sp. 3794]